MIRPRTVRHQKRQQAKAALTQLLRNQESSGIQISSTAPSSTEIDSILQLQATCWDPTMWDTYDETRKRFNDPDWIILLARDTRYDSMIVGLCAGHLIGPELHIYTCEVHPTYRQRGLGQNLVQLLIHLGNLRQAEYCTLYALNPGAQRMAQRIGFKETGRIYKIHAFSGPEMRVEIADIL